MRVIIRESADADIERIHNPYRRPGAFVAASVIARIMAAIERLGDFPRTGHIGREPDTLSGWFVICLTSSFMRPTPWPIFSPCSPSSMEGNGGDRETSFANSDAP
jgi:hypothetical protein